jgi:glycosyltransferase involved in cell wall biosynthesis
MIHVLLLDHSQTGTVGGSLTGLIHLIYGLDPGRYRTSLVLYERKDLRGVLDGADCNVITLNGAAPAHPSARRQLGDNRPGPLAQARRTAGTVRRLVSQTLPRARTLYEVLRRERPDLMHVGNGLKSNLDAVIAARWAGVPCVVHEKGLVRYTAVERFYARGVAACICMTEAIRLHLARERVRMPRTVVVHDGIDVERFRPRRTAAAVRAEFGLADCDPLIGITSHVSPWKGQDVLVRGLPDLVVDFPRLGCLVVGGVVRGAEEFARGLEAFVAARGLGPHVRFTGHRSDIADVVGTLDVLVHASARPEPFGRILIEAMALGKPVVATNGGGVPEIVVDGETGLLVAPADVEAMTAAIRRLLGDSDLRRRFGAAGARRVRDCFSLQSYVPGVEAVYAEVLARERGAGAPAHSP